MILIGRFVVSYYRIVGYFLKVFIFGYFEEAFFCKNKFLGTIFIPKYILMIKKMLVCTHVITLSLQYEGILSQ